jgi:hypothetical protein
VSRAVQGAAGGWKSRSRSAWSRLVRGPSDALARLLEPDVKGMLDDKAVASPGRLVKARFEIVGAWEWWSGFMGVSRPFLRSSGGGKDESILEFVPRE